MNEVGKRRRERKEGSEGRKRRKGMETTEEAELWTVTRLLTFRKYVI